MKRSKIFFGFVMVTVILLFAFNLHASNCLQHVGTFFKSSGSQGVDSILVIHDAQGKLTNKALITVNRDNIYSGELGTFLYAISVTENSTDDNVSVSVDDNVSIGAALGLTLNLNHVAYSFLKSFFNGEALGYTTFDNDSYVWLIGDNGSFKSLKLPNIQIIDLAASEDDNSKFYVLGVSGGYNHIYAVDGDLTSYIDKFSINAGTGQILYDVYEEGAELDFITVIGNVGTKILEFTSGEGSTELDFLNYNDVSSVFDNSSNISKWFATKETCTGDYDFFKFAFDHVAVYKTIDNETDGSETYKLVSTLKLWDPASGYIAGNVLYLPNFGAGIHAVDISDPENLNESDIIGDTINDFSGLPQEVKGMVINGNFYIIAAGGWAGLGVFKANACYPNYNLDGIFKPLQCEGDNGTGGDNGTTPGTDNGTSSCVNACFNAADVDNLGSGWSLAGTGCDINDLSIFDSVKTVWKWSGSSWIVYSPVESINNLLLQYNIPSITLIHAKEGFWINK